MSQQKITAESRAPLVLKYEYRDQLKNGNAVEFRLYTDGSFTVNDVALEWYRERNDGPGWVPAKFQSFKSLVKQMLREGDFD